MLKFCRFVATRFLLAIVTLLIVTFIVFSLMELSPVRIFERCMESISRGLITGESGFVTRHEYYVIRWLNWALDIFLHGDFGFACIARQQINDLIGDRFWLSLGICLSSLLLAYLIALPIGIY